MKSKAILLLLFLGGISMSVMGQVKEQASSLAKQQAETFLLSLKESLQGGTKIKQDEKNGKQFIVSEQFLNEKKVKQKKRSLGEIVEKLQTLAPTQFSSHITSVTPTQVKELKGKKTKVEVINPKKLNVNVGFQSKSVLNSGDVARYKVTLVYTATIDSNKTKGKYIKNVKYKETVATPIDMLDSEKAALEKALRDAANNSVAEWYKNLDKNLPAEYREQAIEALPTVAYKGNVKLNGYTSFTVNDAPEITFKVDPEQFIKPEDRAKYKNPEAKLKIRPTFVGKLDKTAKKVTDLVVKYDTTYNAPITDSVKYVRFKNAENTALDFLGILKSYAENSDKALRADLERRFISPNAKVAVSHLSKNGKETIKERTVKQYLSRVKANELDPNVVAVTRYSENLDEVEFAFEQKFDGKNYGDFTRKLITLKLDKDSDKFLIDSIKVQEGSTQPN